MIGVKMSRSPANEAAHEVPDISGNESCSSSDDRPLSELLRPHTQQKHENRHSSSTKSHKDQSDVSSDDEPLITRKVKSAKKPTKNESTPPRNNNSTSKSSDKDVDESREEPSPEPTKDPGDKKPEEPEENNASSDDEPLSEVAKKLYPQRKRKATVFLSAQKPVKSKRKSAKKAVRYTEVSSDDSDDEPLITFLKTNQAKEKKPPAKAKTAKQTAKTQKGSSSDEDVPLTDLVSKKKTVKRNTRRKAVSPGRASRKRRGGSDDSSDDEPLKRKQTKSKAKTPSPKKSNRTPKKTKKTPASGQSSNSSDDEALIKAAKHPQVTKIPKVILERCDG